jgi:outer membrane protein insertion porin family
LRSVRFLLLSLLLTASLLADNLSFVFKGSIGDSVKLTKIARALTSYQFSDDENLKKLTLSPLFLNAEKEGDSFYLTPAYLIRDIEIRGEFPLFEKEIHRSLTISSGTFWSDSTLVKQKKRVEDRLSKFGFINSYVEITPTYFKEDGIVDLKIKIGKSKIIRISSFEFVKNSTISDFRLGLNSRQFLYKMPLIPGARFVENNIRDDVRDLKKYYRSRGFPEISLDYSFESSENGEGVKVEVEVVEGPKYRVKYKKTPRALRKMMKREINFDDDGNRNDRTLKSGIKKVEEGLEQRGFSNANLQIIDTFFEKRGDKRRDITFRLEEGEQVRVRSVNFFGNNGIKSSKLKSAMLTVKSRPKKSGTGAFNPKNLEKDLENLRNFYYQNGFLKRVIKSSVEYLADSSEVLVKVVVDEGIRTEVSDVKISGVSDSLKNEIIELISLKIGEGYSPKFLAKDRIIIESTVSELGYVSVTVDMNLFFSEDSSIVLADIVVNRGEKVELDDIIFVGNFKTKDKKLLKVSKLESGKPLSMRSIYEGVQNIRKTGQFSSVSHTIPNISDSIKEVSLIVNLDEKKPYLLSGSVGYESEILGFANLTATNKNLFGYNKELFFNIFFSKYDQQLNLGFKEPHLFETDWISTINLYTTYESKKNRDYFSIIRGNSYGLNYNLNRKFITATTMAYEWRYSEAINDSVNFSFRDRVGTDGSSRNVISLEEDLSLDLRNSPLYPTMGIYSRVGMNFSYGIDSHDDRFVRPSGEIRAYLTPLSFLTIASRVSGGVVLSYGDADSISVDQLFTLGGIGNVRGVEQDLLFKDEEGNVLYGYRSIFANFETRLKFISWGEITAFLDGGTMSSEVNDNSLLKPRLTVGGGFRFLSPIGPISLVYGVPLDDDKESENMVGVIHFSIGYSF